MLERRRGRRLWPANAELTRVPLGNKDCADVVACVRLTTRPKSAFAGFNCAEAVNFGPPDWLPWGSYVADKYRAEGRSATLSHDALLVALVRAAPAVAARAAGKPWPDPARNPDRNPAAPASPAVKEEARAAAPPAAECAGLRQQGLGYIKADAAPAPMPDPAVVEPPCQAAGAAVAGAGMRMVEQAGVPPRKADGSAVAAEVCTPTAAAQEPAAGGGGSAQAMDVDAVPGAAAAGAPPAAEGAGAGGPAGAGDLDSKSGRVAPPVSMEACADAAGRRAASAGLQALAGCEAQRGPAPGPVRVDLQPRGDGVALHLSMGAGQVSAGTRHACASLSQCRAQSRSLPALHPGHCMCVPQALSRVACKRTWSVKVCALQNYQQSCAGSGTRLLQRLFLCAAFAVLVLLVSALSNFGACRGPAPEILPQAWQRCACRTCICHTCVASACVSPFHFSHCMLALHAECACDAGRHPARACRGHRFEPCAGGATGGAGTGVGPGGARRQRRRRAAGVQQGGVHLRARKCAR